MLVPNLCELLRLVVLKLRLVAVPMLSWPGLSDSVKVSLALGRWPAL